MLNPPETLNAVTHMRVAHPVALCDPGPNFSKHHAAHRHGKRKKKGHCDCCNPTVFGGRILAPEPASYRYACKAVEQQEGQVHDKINASTVAPQSCGYKS